MWIDPRTMMKDMMFDSVMGFIDEARAFFSDEPLDPTQILKEAHALHEKMGSLKRKYEQALQANNDLCIPAIEIAFDRMASKTQGYLIGKAVINGVSHHVELVQVHQENDCQEAAHKESADIFNDFPHRDGACQQISDPKDKDEKQYVVMIHPYVD